MSNVRQITDRIGVVETALAVPALAGTGSAAVNSYTSQGGRKILTYFNKSKLYVPLDLDAYVVKLKSPR